VQQFINQVFENKKQAEEAIKKDTEKKKSFKVMHMNIRSLRKNWEQLTQHLESMHIKWEIIILTEINIKKEESELYELEGYNKTTLTRENTARGGGIMVFINKSEEARTRTIEIGESNAIEIVIMGKNTEKETQKENNIQIIAVYRKPSSNRKEFVKKLKNWIESTETKWESQMIIGDINIDILDNNKTSEDNYDQKSIDYYENTLARLGFECKMNSPTREELVEKMERVAYNNHA